jgi:hypothetical protein
MSWLFSRVLVEEFLGAKCLDGEPSAQLNGNPIPQAYLQPDKMKDFLRVSRFGMMFAPLTDDLGVELLTLYLAGFHAKTLAQQEKAQGLTESVAECGEKWQGSFSKYDQSLCSWKTHQCSLLGGLDEFLETWPQWGLMRNGECWERQTLEQTIKGTEFGLLPNGVDSFHTPNTTGLDGGSNSRKALRARMEKLPTPQATDHRSKPTSASWKAKGGMNYSLSNPEIQKMWPTPQASDNRDRGNMSNPSIQRRVAIGKQIMLSQSVDPNSGQLNPTWVEWLMGWPLGWTDLKRLETDKYHFAQQPHGES